MRKSFPWTALSSLQIRLLLPVFVSDGQNLHRASARPAYHVLRHTFAAHFMMSGGNILALQKILGHHDIKMTMRYAHLAPDHLETALRFNPLATMSANKTSL